MARRTAPTYSGGMTVPHRRPAQALPAPQDDVPLRTRRWCTVAMIPAAMFMCLAQISFAAQPYLDDDSSPMMVWLMLGTLLSFVFPFALLARDRRPETVFWVCCAIVLVLPYDPLLMLMALTSLLARRSSTARCARAVAAATAVGVWAQLRDAMNPPDASLWHEIFARPRDRKRGEPLVTMAGETTIMVTAVVVALIAVLLAVLIGLHIRSRARLHEAHARTQAAQHHADSLQSDLTNQQLADAIAAEMHDTLAHSLSLIALNASALQAQAARLAADAHADADTGSGDADTLRMRADAIARKAEDIRRQSAGALDEAHATIDMLRHPGRAWEQLAPDKDTALTREALDTLIGEARQAGMALNTWIDIQQLSDLGDHAGKVAYRAIQEGLTNARRHAAGMPVSLEVTARPELGVHVHVSNPTAPAPHGAPAGMSGRAGAPAGVAVPAPAPMTAGARSPATPPRTGEGLAGLAARAHSAHGSCRYGLDPTGVFHVDVTLPWSDGATVQ